MGVAKSSEQRRIIPTLNWAPIVVQNPEKREEGSRWEEDVYLSCSQKIGIGQTAATFTETHKNPFRVWEAARIVISLSSQNQNVKNANRFVGRPVRNVMKLRPRTSSDERVQFCRDPLTWFWPVNRRSLNDEQRNYHKVPNKQMWCDHHQTDSKNWWQLARYK